MPMLIVIELKHLASGWIAASVPVAETNSRSRAPVYTKVKRRGSAGCKNVKQDQIDRKFEEMVD